MPLSSWRTLQSVFRMIVPLKIVFCSLRLVKRLPGDEYTRESRQPSGDYTGKSHLPGGEYTRESRLPCDEYTRESTS
jgi:hypothetical protein